MEITESKGKLLYKWYVLNHNTLEDVSNHINKSKSYVKKLLISYTIPLKPENRHFQRPYIFIPKLKEMYYKEGLSQVKIGNYFGCSDYVISQFMKEHNIEILPNTRKAAGANKGKPMPIKQRHKLSATRKKLFKDGKILHPRLGVVLSDETKAKISESLRKRNSNSGNSYRDGHYRSDFNRNRKLALLRDEYSCQQCYTKESLHVHHWEPYRISCNDQLDNLVTLCSSCHSWLHQEYIREGFYEDCRIGGLI